MTIQVLLSGEQPGYGYNNIVGIQSFAIEDPGSTNLGFLPNLNFYRSPSPVKFTTRNPDNSPLVFTVDKKFNFLGIEFLLPAGQSETAIGWVFTEGGSGIPVVFGNNQVKKLLHYGNVQAQKFLVLPSDNMEFTPGEDLNLYFQTKENYKITQLKINNFDWAPGLGEDATKATVNFGSYQDDVLLDAIAVSIFEYAKKMRIWGVMPDGRMKVSDWVDISSSGSLTLPRYGYDSVILEGEGGRALPNGTFKFVSGGVGWDIISMGDKQYVQGQKSFFPGVGEGNVTYNAELDVDSDPPSVVDTNPPLPLNPQDPDSGIKPGEKAKPVPAGQPLPVPPSLTPEGGSNQVSKDRESIPDKPQGSGSCLDPCMQDQIAVLKWIGDVLDKRLGQIYEVMVSGFDGVHKRMDRQEQSLAADLEKAAALGDDLDDILENIFGGDDGVQVGIGKAADALEGIESALFLDGDTSGKSITDVIKENDPVYIAQIEGADLRITGQGVGMGPDT